MNTSAKLIRVLQRLDKACNTVCKNAPNRGLWRPKVDASDYECNRKVISKINNCITFLENPHYSHMMFKK